MVMLERKQEILSKIYKIEEIGRINKFFTEAKIYVMHDGMNRNGSDIALEVIDKAIPTIYNIPIVGKFLEDRENFSDHAMKLQKNKLGVKELKSETVPYGTIPESAKIYWEEVEEDSGELKNYLVIDGAILWTGRYPDVLTIHDEGYYNQSMEIYMDDYSYEVSGDKEVLEIREFTFTGLCMLGVAKDTDVFGHEEPAFNQGRVIAYSLEDESFSNQFKEMIRELQFTLKEGVENVPTVLETEENKVTINDDGIKIEGDNITVQDEPTKVEPQPEPTKEEPIKEDPTPEPQPVKEEPQPEPQPEPEKQPEPVASFSVTEEEFNTLQDTVKALNTEVFELRQYKRERELGDLRFKFEGQVSEQELNELIDSRKDAEISALELEIFALIGKTNFSLNNNTKEEVNKAPVLSPQKEDKEYSPYGDITFLK